jgi:two-component system, cell cycle sensor histidine kinase and response regulator CckA
MNLRFLSPRPPIAAHLRDGFRKEQEMLVMGRVNIIILLGCAFVPAFGLADYLLYPQYFARFTVYRLIAGACCLALFGANQRWKLGFRSFYLGIAAAYIVGLTIIRMIVEAGGYATPYYAGLVLVFLGMCAVLTVRIELLVVHSLILYFVYVLSVFFFTPHDQVGLFLTNNMFLISAMVIALVANNVDYRLRLREYLVRRELESAQEQLKHYSKDLENLFSESESMYQIVVDNANESIFVLQDDVMKFPNPATLELFGHAKEELARIPFMHLVHEEDRNIWSDQKQRLLGSRKAVSSSTFRVLKSSGGTVWADMNAVSIEWIDRPALLVFLRDVTEKKVMEGELVHAQKMEAIGTLAGGIAHDFNNLLTGVLGYASLMLLDKDVSDLHYERLKSIEQLVQSGSNLTRQLLGFARGGKFEVKPTDLNELVKASSEMFGRTRREISIHGKYQKDLPTVDVDGGQIEQVLLNLFVNAWQAMSEGGDLYLATQSVALDGRYTEHHLIPPGNYVRISVTDTGTGMDQATLQRIFEPFFTTKEAGRGTGLGLATAYSIIKNHGGIINVYSELGRGTTFNVYFPASQSHVTSERPVSPEIISSTGTILLIDDQETILNVGKDMLGALGYEVCTALGGERGLALYAEKIGTIDLVILDMIMPSLSGAETYDRLKAMDPGVKVILSSGYNLNTQAEKIISHGCNGFIQKPFHISDLSLKIREVLGERTSNAL